MKTVLYIFGGLVVLGLIIYGFTSFGGSSAKVAGYPASDPNAPKIEIGEKKWDFGKISLNDVVTHEFKFKNTGKNPLIITDLMTSCHCTTVVMRVSGKPDSPEFGMHSEGNWQGEVPPDSEAVLQVEYEPAKHPAKGQISRVVTFSSNDPANKDVQLEVVAEVE